MNKLIKWLKEKDRTMAWLAREIGVQAPLLSRALKNVQPLSLEVCEAIHKITAGEVKLKDLRPDLAKKYKRYGCLKELFVSAKKTV